MAGNTVPRVARFADLREGMTIERVCARPSGSTITYAGVVSKVTARHVIDAEDGVLAWLADDSVPRVTLRILDDPSPKPLPVWGTLVRVIGGELDGKRAAAIGYGDCPWYAESDGWASDNTITDWEVIYDPTAPKADAADAPKDDAPKPHKTLPDWGVLVRAVGGRYDGKRAFVTRNEQLHLTRWVVEDRYVPVEGDEITDWIVICDPNASKADLLDHFGEQEVAWWADRYDPKASDAADPLDENDHRDRIDNSGNRVVRRADGGWNACGDAECGGRDLAWWSNRFGPLRFADEVTA